MATTIKLKNSVTTTNAPSSLAQGEVAINVTDKKVWVGNAATTPVQLLGTGADGSLSTLTVGAGTVSAPAITTTGDTNTGIFFPAADTIAFTEGGAESMRIDSSGNLGIGTSSPSYKLDVAGQSNLNGIRIGLNGDTINASGNLLAFQGAGSERMRIDSTGRVLFGTTTAGIGANGNTALTIENGTATVYASLKASGGQEMILGADSTNGVIFGSFSNNNLIFRTNNTERMRIDSSGVLLVACTALPTGGVGGISLSSPATSNGMLLGTTGTGATNMIRFYNPNGNVGAITTSGTTTTYATSSDYRLKEDVAPMTGALDKVAQLKPVTYKWKIDGSDGQGFIAHELQAVVPECVTGEKDAVDEEGNPQYQGIDTSFLVATLTAALQEQQAIINDLKARIETIESK